MQKKRNAANSLITRWGRQVEQEQDKDAILKEYPRPCMVRENWQCLNGLWKYAFTKKKERPAVFEGDILVPFSPETRLSGVGRQLKPGEYLWYERQITFAKSIKRAYGVGGRILLHFGAVDFHCVVFINGKKAGEHSGGYLPFSFDITKLVKQKNGLSDSTEETEQGHSREVTGETVKGEATRAEATKGQSEEVPGCLITLRVDDPSDTSYHSVGKQTLTPGGMYYMATGGIWQTVWLEAVPSCYIKDINWEPLYDVAKLKLEVIIENKSSVKFREGGAGAGAKTETESATERKEDAITEKNQVSGEEVEAEPRTESADAWNERAGTEQGKELDAEQETRKGPAESLTIRLTFLNAPYEEQLLPAGESCLISLPDFISWSPENPWLYRVRLTLCAPDGTVLDSVDSYFAMRKCSIGTDSEGIPRILLNNHPYMQAGVLDQGYWPESMYTAPSEDAMVFDIKSMKSLGFNMLRKHVKVEPQRWYYLCDRLGILVWQDMVNGGRKNKSFYVTYLATVLQMLGVSVSDRHPFLLSRQDKKGREEYEKELTEMVKRLKAHPSVVCVVPFNEGWGQFETDRMTKLAHRQNQGIIIDQASGWFDMGSGDIKSLHWYFGKLRYKKDAVCIKKASHTQKPVRALALTEFGGYARKLAGHTSHEKVYGYKIFATKEALEEGYRQLLETVTEAAGDGISATVYTQLSDVEEEINGLYTYDREVLKMDAELVLRCNKELRMSIDKL